MRFTLTLFLFLLSSAASAQYACTTEQLRDRFKPSVPLDAQQKCPPGYEIATFDNGLTNRCASPAVRLDDTLDAQYGDYRSRNADGTTHEFQDANGERWTVETYDVKGRPSVIRNPDGSVTTLMWTRMNVYERNTDGHLTRYQNWIDGKPTTVETAGVGYVVLGWDQDRISVERIESSSRVLLGIDRTLAPLRSQTASSAKFGSTVGITAAAAAPLYLIIDFAATPGAPLIAVGAAAVGGYALGTYIYPIIEPALTTVIDACATAAETENQKCRREAEERMKKRDKQCTNEWQAAGAAGASDSKLRELFLACHAKLMRQFINEMAACEGKPPVHPEEK